MSKSTKGVYLTGHVIPSYDDVPESAYEGTMITENLDTSAEIKISLTPKPNAKFYPIEKEFRLDHGSDSTEPAEPGIYYLFEIQTFVYPIGDPIEDDYTYTSYDYMITRDPEYSQKSSAKRADAQSDTTSKLIGKFIV